MTKGIHLLSHTNDQPCGAAPPRLFCQPFVILNCQLQFHSQIPYPNCLSNFQLSTVDSDPVADSSDCQFLNPSATWITCSRILLNPTGFPDRTCQLFNHSQSIRISSSALHACMHARVSRCPSADCLSQRRRSIPRAAAHTFRVSEIRAPPRMRSARQKSRAAPRARPACHNWTLHNS